MALPLISVYIVLVFPLVHTTVDISYMACIYYHVLMIFGKGSGYDGVLRMNITTSAGNGSL